MTDLLSDLFPNFCILVTLLFVTTTLVPQEPGQIGHRRKYLIVLCMAVIPLLLYRYGLALSPGMRFDLRYVPIALATLWGGPLIGAPEGMHFGSVRALRRVGTEVRIRLAGNSDDAVLHLDAESTAKRVHDALEYLRLHCDATRATGF